MSMSSASSALPPHYDLTWQDSSTLVARSRECEIGSIVFDLSQPAFGVITDIRAYASSGEQRSQSILFGLARA
jgi:hypothetical protein